MMMISDELVVLVEDSLIAKIVQLSSLCWDFSAMASSHEFKVEGFHYRPLSADSPLCYSTMRADDHSGSESLRLHSDTGCAKFTG